MTGRPKGWMAALVLFVLVFSSREAGAQDGDMPIGRFGLLAGIRQNRAEVGDAYRFGWVVGLSAGYHPRSLPVGATWSVSWARHYRSDPTFVKETIGQLEMNFGLEARLPISSEHLRYLFAGGGLTLQRSDSPLPPDNERNFSGPYAGGGYQELFFSEYLLQFEVRYGLIVGGPSSIAGLITVYFGSY